MKVYVFVTEDYYGGGDERVRTYFSERDAEKACTDFVNDTGGQIDCRIIETELTTPLGAILASEAIQTI